MIYTGIIKTGKNDFNFWINKLQAYYKEKTGLDLFPGTLNVHLIDAEFHIPKNSRLIRLEGYEYEGNVNVSIYPCRIFGRKAFILRTDTDTGKHGDNAEQILEIATDFCIRKEHNLNDGDTIKVKIEDV
jgi:riboflavin kinase, archaea type